MFQSFFGRTYNNLNSVSECKNNGECVINKKNRTSCKACRLRKCLLVGMSKSGSRYGRRSNWFKIHCLLQEQQLQQQQQQQQLQQTQLTVGVTTKKPWEFAKNVALLDIDNNNMPAESKSESPPFLGPHGLVKTVESPSFWSSSPTFSVPHQHALPYFISPFLQGPLSPAGYLPFLPIRPPLPLEPLVIPSPPSSLHSSPPAVITPKKERTPETDIPLEQLRSLGPEQEQPIDLSSAKAQDNRETTPVKKGRVSETVSKNTIRECDDGEVEKCELSAKTTNPLDLRCSKS